jgi:CubicO group peptidase (beta-lactamase class C family)
VVSGVVVAALLGAPIGLAQESAQPPDSATIRQRIAAYLLPFTEVGQLSGNLLVARGDRVLYEGSFGMANYELAVPVRPETRFNIASITKPMTLIALIRLIEQQKLTMQDKLSKWIPDFPRGDEITIQQLARHTAGIPHRLTEPRDETVPTTAEEMVERARHATLMSEPGATRNYSSGGFSVLARVLELAAGQSYQDLLRELVFEPAGMAHSVHTDSRSLLPGRADCYLLDTRGGVVNGRLQDLSFLVGAGSVYSTARDLHALLRAVRDGSLGERVRENWAGREAIEWNGVTDGFRAFADWHGDSDVTVVLTANLQTGAANQIRWDVARIAAGEDVPPFVLPKIEPATVSSESLRRFEGTYELRPGSPLEVHVDRGTLRVNDWTLIATGERTFFSPQDYAVVEVVVDENGEPLRLDWTIGGQTHPCPRVD